MSAIQKKLEEEEKFCSEMQDNYIPPPPRRPLVTRALLFERFLYNELYDEYLKAVCKEPPRECERPKLSEYHQKFSALGLCGKSKKKIDDLVDKYPICGAPAITFWNPKIEQPRNFNLKSDISKPISEKNQQFG